MIVRLTNTNDKTLLEQVEGRGIQTNAQCREGYCGACRCRLVSGTIEHTETPLAFVNSNEVLLCCSIAKSDVEIEIN